MVFFLYAGDMGVYQLYKLNILMTMTGYMLILTIFLAKTVTLHYNKNVTATISVYGPEFIFLVLKKFVEIPCSCSVRQLSEVLKSGVNQKQQ